MPGPFVPEIPWWGKVGTDPPGEFSFRDFFRIRCGRQGVIDPVTR